MTLLSIEGFGLDNSIRCSARCTFEEHTMRTGKTIRPNQGTQDCGEGGFGMRLILCFIMSGLCLAGVANPTHAQTQIDATGKYFCSASAVGVLKKGVFKPVSETKLQASNKKQIKALKLRLKKASKKKKAAIKRAIANLTTLSNNIVACLNGDYEPSSPLALGKFHSCAIRDTGQVSCWGYNALGQLGDGTTANSSSPVDVVGLSGSSIAVSAGHSHSCAVSSEGGVSCWGANSYGQLGNGATSSQSGVVQVVGLASGAKKITSGRYHTCALTTAGAVKCWGSNSDGQLGSGSFDDSSVPVDVSGLSSGIKDITAGELHTCAILQDKTVACWGSNTFLQIGASPEQISGGRSAIPVEVLDTYQSASDVDAGAFHTCAVLSGEVYCWGLNGDGQLGIGEQGAASFPIASTAVEDSMKRVVCGGIFSCGITTVQDVRCWGGNDAGYLGDGTFLSSLTPVSASGLSGILGLEASQFHACALLSNKSVACWGSNTSGQLGNNNASQQSTPAIVAGLTTR